MVPKGVIRGDKVVRLSMCVGSIDDSKHLSEWFDCTVWGDSDAVKSAITRKGLAVVVTGLQAVRVVKGKTYRSVLVRALKVEREGQLVEVDLSNAGRGGKGRKSGRHGAGEENEK